MCACVRVWVSGSVCGFVWMGVCLCACRWGFYVRARVSVREYVPVLSCGVHYSCVPATHRILMISTIRRNRTTGSQLMI